MSLHTTDGLALEGELAVPPDAWAAAVLAHPHPQQGGNMRSIVPGVLFDALPAAGVAVLRFNFRGVGRSEGAHDFGTGEQSDIVAAIDALHPITEGLPLVLAGWSFGADTSLAVDDARLSGWCAMAPPLRVIPLDRMVAATDPRPKLIVVPERDRFRTPDEVREMTQDWVSTRIEAIAGTDHFFLGRTDQLAPLLVELLGELSPAEG
jgi:alpha/beta superfamily hydrolase